MSFDLQMNAARAHATRAAFQKKVADAEDGIHAMTRLSRRSYVSLSFGKQSLCLADMVARIDPDARYFFLASGETWDLHDYADVVEAFCRTHPQIDLTIVQTNVVGIDIDHHIARLRASCPAITWDMRNWHPPEGDWKTCRDRGDNDIQTMCDRADWDGWYMGLAKEESKARAITLSRTWDGQPHPAIFRYKDGKFRCCPMARWTTHDVAAYVATRDLPLLDAYRIGGFGERTTARMTKMMVAQGGLTLIKERQPDGYNRIVRRFPELEEMLFKIPFASSR